mmetsp:Transcript_59235/g.105254  ORF Transcript_59235/g.105254 Transcript_59235/m.105254 type:complete len:1938 (-) Transcript_59235:102-5915(-)|eukprot:CAMPEP_0197638690 /NCGR_PEP_ID=MMETSP1338-20131121/13550_1 /TAXON_ID=43686 ORGANISM="Pelagodinium beii, Strain RCC1491" /NCGR_SAMPLE_ID=MMETSP1338 /ASSEMBLY_ACC=CAM_ASM_000754 /LENGTH=1937 /DNA_ID=CAMNT_0043211313 /DNA_START=106 /DNA_END=5922 /DNA_ORIENTATION=+
MASEVPAPPALPSVVPAPATSSPGPPVPVPASSGPGRPDSPFGQPQLLEDSSAWFGGNLHIVSDGDVEHGQLPRIKLYNKELEVCRKSLYVFPLTSKFRGTVIKIVMHWAFDKFILSLILLNSICLAMYIHRPDDSETIPQFNWVSDNIIDRILLGFFALELILKVIAFGFFVDSTSYMRDMWNWLDFVVVVTGIMEQLEVGGGIGFLRLFRILRPLRSLNAVPQMKVLVNTVLSSIPRLGNVSIMGIFLFLIFGILGVSLLNGIFFRSCRLTPNPVLKPLGLNGSECWYWPPTGEERLCGGEYMCKAPEPGIPSGFCGGHPEDTVEGLRPKFEGGQRGIAWCDGSEPRVIFPENEWINFDHMGSAVLLIFQCMTLEGWTDVMYRVQDAYDFWMGTAYFFLLIPVTSFFLLNVALAVVDEAREDFQDEAEEEEAAAALIADMQEKEEKVEETADASPSPARARVSSWLSAAGEEMMQNIEEADADEEQEQAVWWDVLPVRYLRSVAQNEIFTNLINFVIAANVVTMSLETFEPQVAWQDATEMLETTFLIIFSVEMVVMIGGHGPKRYVLTPSMSFDGCIVAVSVAQAISQVDGGPFTALRTLRLLRVLNKLASRWPAFRVLLKAMYQTAKSLVYWLVLFFLFLYICTLMWTTIFAREFHFNDPDSLDAPSADQGDPWCASDGDPLGLRDNRLKQDCIPRAHFDTFLWSLVTIFQIMTGENWNTIMYAGMRAKGYYYALLFVLLIVFGQILFLSLFLSMLLSKFDEVQDEMERQENEKQAAAHRPEKKMKEVGMMQSVIKAFTKDKMQVQPEPDEADPEMAQVVPQPKAQGGPKPWQVDAEEAEGEGDQDDDEPGKPYPEKPSGSADNLVDEKPALPAPKNDSGPPAPPQAPSEEEEPEPKPWPQGYAWYIFSETNPARKAANKLLNWKVEIRGDKTKVFDNFILACILVSSVGMAIDTPLRNPADPFTAAIRQADTVFAMIFAGEMAVKLLAQGLFLTEKAYLKDGWNILDGVVVIVSITDMVAAGSGGFLKTLRIMRAFRPLRVISRNENLRVVVQTMFDSLLDLFTLMVVASLFLLIFALFGVAMLSGRMHTCNGGDVADIVLIRDLHQNPDTRAIAENFTVPLCLGDDITKNSCAHGTYFNVPGQQAWQLDSAVTCGTTGSTCSSDFSHSWRRASADTPICVGRCITEDYAFKGAPSSTPPEWLCPKPLEKASELPSVCENAQSPDYIAGMSDDERRGWTYVEAMMRQLAIPCGGSMVDSSGDLVTGKTLSCAEAFCPEGASDEKKESCKLDCEKHPNFCEDACSNGPSATCESCRLECRAACECREHCEPLIKDAALCVEQGGSWDHQLSQNFDNIFNAMLTLFEISSTEGWVDVMYSAADSTEMYKQPLRDTNEVLFVLFFMVYMFFSFMFIINLSVGVIVDKFMDLKESGKGDILLTQAQTAFVASQNHLLKRKHFFDLTDLHTLPPGQRKVYDMVSSNSFTGFIMAAIALNSALMGMKIFNPPIDWWAAFLWWGMLLFFCVFTMEFFVKMYALRSAYWEDNWNKFDFFCIIVSLSGYIIQSTTSMNTSALGMFRVARLFRLLKYLKGVKKIFAALAASIPKLVNVLLILLLLLVLYSILGVSLFSTTKLGDTLDTHGNFQNFVLAFITLFRASTGEAWNELMHDLAKSPAKIFRSGDWCTMDSLFDPENDWEVLNSKCLIERPNACVPEFWMGRFMPIFYWSSYTLIVSIMVMNLVIAVILESYEDGKGAREVEIIEAAIQVWKKYDPDITLSVKSDRGIAYIFEVLEKAMADDEEDQKLSAFQRVAIGLATGNSRMSAIPMKFANTLDLPVDENGKVHFFGCIQQVLKLFSVKTNPELMDELSNVEDQIPASTAMKLKLSAYLLAKTHWKNAKDDIDRPASVQEHIAALKLQGAFRAKRKAAQIRAQQ